MKLERKFTIRRPKPGVLIYGEGHTEYRFPLYEDDGESVFVACATGQRLYLHFLHGGWTDVPPEFTKSNCKRITAHVIEHFHAEGLRLRVMALPESPERGFQFHAELFEDKAKATEILEEAGFIWMSDYSSIDLIHEECGLEVCGIREASNVQPIGLAMRRAFPHWHFHGICSKSFGRDPGWKFSIYMFPRRGRDGRWVDAD